MVNSGRGETGRRLRIEYSSGQRAHINKVLKYTILIIVYAIYVYFIWKVNTGQGDKDKTATYWARWACLKGRAIAHKVAYRADLVDLTLKERYEQLTEHAWLA